MDHAPDLPPEYNELSRSDDRRDPASSASKGGSSSSGRSRDRERERDRERDRDRDSKDRDKDKSRSRSDRHSSSKSSRHRSRSRSPRHSSSHRSRRKHSRSRSPSPRKERKRNTMWDQPPGMQGVITGIPSIPGVLPPGSHQSRQATRLYVGNIPTGVTEEEIADFFNTAMLTANSTKESGNPIVSVQINVEKSYAFLEFRSVEEASAGMAFDGITLQGHSLKVRRPKDYQPLPGDSGSMPALPNIVSTNVSDSPHKIFVGGLPANLTEEQVKELVGSFGQLRSFNLVKDLQTGLSKGYAFFEYLDESVTDIACKGLNGMRLGDKTLLVQRAQIGAKNLQHNPQATAAMLAHTNPTALNFLNLAVPIAVVLSNLTVTNPVHSSSVVLLLNMISPEDVTTEEDYQDVYEDVQEEASKYGKVRSIFIPRPDPERKIDPVIGKVFIEYESGDYAKKAHDALGGRKYGGRTVITTFFPTDKYQDKDFT